MKGTLLRLKAREAYLYKLLPGGEPGHDAVPAAFGVRYWNVEAVSGQTVSVAGQNLLYPLPGEEPHTDAPLLGFY